MGFESFAMLLTAVAIQVEDEEDREEEEDVDTLSNKYYS
jgi:hypothetical protein